MTGLDLIERLIGDLEKFIRAKSIARNRDQLRADMLINLTDFKRASNFSLEEGWISLTCDITIPYDLGDLSQFINHDEQLVLFKSGDKVHLSEFLIQLIENKSKIAAIFQKLNDSPNLVVVFGQQQETLFSYLKRKLDDLHNEALSVDHCYMKIAKSRNA